MEQLQSFNNEDIVNQMGSLSISEAQKAQQKLFSFDQHNMPPAELCYKPDQKYNFEVGPASIGKSVTMPNDAPSKPKKTLRKFDKGSKMRQILTKNFVFEVEEEKEADK